MKKIRISNYEHIVILTGAGISKASGIPTFRGEGGLWNDEETKHLLVIDEFYKRPDVIWNFLGSIKEKVLNASPNIVHNVLSEIEKTAKKFTLITQNIDGLHQKAGSKNVIELHGSLLRTRCSNGECNLPVFDDYNVYSKAPRCSICNAILRPDIVFFNEHLGGTDFLAKVALRDCDLYLAIGTSGSVAPASNFARGADYAGARTILINMEEVENPYFHEKILGKAEEIIPILFE